MKELAHSAHGLGCIPYVSCGLGAMVRPLQVIAVGRQVDAGKTAASPMALRYVCIAVGTGAA
ncbi:hypothetical protein ACWD3J_41320 [Streptomyces sp. NPDC002755]|uniref:hypothetical protein n=1 Tax=Streptomyces sp. NPDC002884 TaxID=3154544 RepID=UPI00331A132E